MAARRSCIALVSAVVVVCAGSAEAQYFGTNKVQHRVFDFQILGTEHFDVYFYPNEREGAGIAARLAERWYWRLAQVFDHQLRGRQPLVLYASHPDFEQTNVIQGEIGEGTGGVTEPLRRRIVMPLGGPLADTDHVLGHELVHAFQFDITSGRDRSDRGRGLSALPLWFVEGMAEYLSIGPVSSHTAMWLRDAARQEQLPGIDDLDDSKYFPYRWGHAFWAYVGGRWGDGVVPQLLAVAAGSGNVGSAIETVLGLPAQDLSDAWHASIRSAYDPLRAESTSPAELGRPLITRDAGGNVNVGPALSPDGRWLAFLSERDLFSIDLFVADAATGLVVRRLTSTASSPHATSLQFIQSAGAWDPSSRRLAAATVTRGRAALTIFDGTTGAREREIVVDDVDEIFGPTWAPDGMSVAFAGLSGGLTDLYVYDLAAGSSRRLTNDAFADIQPAWSPDGRRIAFATDRFTSDLPRLAFGDYRLALIDPSTGAIEAVPVFDQGRVSDPQWARDSHTLVFVSDRDGVPNVYRLTLGGAVEQLTRAETGVTGITPTSPAVSVSGDGARAAVTVFDEAGYAIHLLDLASRGAEPLPARTAARTLPPVDERLPSTVAAALADAASGLPAPSTSEIRPYRKSFGVDSVAQPSISIGASRFGAAFGAGLALTFSDMLNDHLFATAVQFNAGLSGGIAVNNTAVQAAYIDQERRWNWGIVGGRIPYVSGFIQTGLTRYQGTVVGVDETTLFRQVETSAAGLVAYPLNRARRIELQGGVTQIAFDQITRTDLYSLSTGSLVNSEARRTSTAPSLTLASSSAAFVSDTSSFGATSPVRGERYRLEVAPTFGTINFTSALGDYRRYFMPAPLYTVAGRALHYGRYGSGAADARMYPLYLGQPTLVRGYDVGSFGAGECVADTSSTCPVFDQLLGTRLIVGNVELRFPLLRPFRPPRRAYGPVPVEVGFFADAGVAWGGSHAGSAANGRGVSSVGTTFRVNLFGSAVAQFDIARPLQRPGAGVVYQFNFTPGF